jgi:hypothetical protein
VNLYGDFISRSSCKVPIEFRLLTSTIYRLVIPRMVKGKLGVCVERAFTAASFAYLIIPHALGSILLQRRDILSSPCMDGTHTRTYTYIHVLLA